MIDRNSINTVVFVKTTGEPVFLLDIDDEGTAFVRRPTQTDAGVVHLSEGFQAAELQTLKGKVAQELEEQSYFLDQRRAFERASNESKSPVN